jgi:hypothetical protein
MQDIPYIVNKLNEQLLHLLVFHAYINEMRGSRSKIPSKNFVRQRCAEGFNYGVKGLKTNINVQYIHYSLYRRLGGPYCRSGRVRKISTPQWDSITGPSSTIVQSLYRLSYRGPSKCKFSLRWANCKLHSKNEFRDKLHQVCLLLKHEFTLKDISMKKRTEYSALKISILSTGEKIYNP